MLQGQLIRKEKYGAFFRKNLGPRCDVTSVRSVPKKIKKFFPAGGLLCKSFTKEIKNEF